MKYKLICTDMDGTLLNSEKKVSEKTLESIKRAHEKGIKIAITTGRIFISAKYYGDLLKIQAPIIASNGAYIREENNIIYKCILGIENCNELLKIFNEYDLVPHFYTAKGIFAGDSTYTSKFYEKANEILPLEFKMKIETVDNWDNIFEKNQMDILKAVAIDDDLNKIKKAKEHIKKIGKYEVVSSFSNNFEVMSKNVSKGNAVKKLTEYYDISKDQVIAIGDNENDISMIEYAGLGIAMENATDETKKAANYTTDTNDNDGVKKVIDKFILE